MASTMSPICTREESAKLAGERLASTWTTARSSGGKEPTRVPSYCLPAEVVTRKAVALPTTWALVTMSPFPSKTTPEPRPAGVVIWTTLGLTALTTWTKVCSRVTASPPGLTTGFERTLGAEPEPEAPEVEQAASSTVRTSRNAAPGTVASLIFPAPGRLRDGALGSPCLAMLSPSYRSVPGRSQPPPPLAAQPVPASPAG